MQFQDRIV